MGRHWQNATLFALTLLTRLTIGPWPIDDAYITFRYARNVIQGAGLVYNPGEWTLGTSSPLFAGLLALCSWATGSEIPGAALALNAVADAISSLIVWRLCTIACLSPMQRWLCSLSFVFHPLVIKYSVGGMETPIVTALTLAAFALTLTRRWGRAAAVSGLAIFVRPDAAAATVLVLLATTAGGRVAFLRSTALAVVPVLVWVGYASWRYGSALPQSVLAKSQQIYLIEPLENARQVFYQLGGLVVNNPMGVSAHGLTLALPDPLVVPLLIAGGVLVLLWIAGVKSLITQHLAWLPSSAYLPALAGTYAVLGYGGGIMAEWYLVPATPLFLLGLFAGIQWMHGISAMRPIAVVLVVSIPLMQVAGLSWGRIPGRRWWVPATLWTERENLYREAAKFLVPRLAPSDIVAASEIGALGFYCHCRVLDTVGLVSPEALAYYPLPANRYEVNYAVPAELLYELEPDFLVSLDVFTRQSVTRQARFAEMYNLEWSRATTAFGSSGLEVYARDESLGH